MVGTILSVLIAILVYFSSSEKSASIAYVEAVTQIIVATLFLLMPTLIAVLAWSPLQQAEKGITPNVGSLYRKDLWLNSVSIYLYAFSFISYVFAVGFIYLNFLDHRIFFPIWLVLFGVAIDALRYVLARTSAYFDPMQVSELFGKEGLRSVHEEREVDLCRWIEALSDIGVRGIQRSSISLSNQVADELQKIGRIFLESSKTVGFHDQQMANGDKISYTLFFLLQRLEMINDKAVEQRLEPVCSHLITTVSKLVIDAAKCDITLPQYPLHFLGRFAIKAQAHGLQEVGPKALCALLEIARTILNDIDITYLSLNETFTSLIAQMHEISKEMFRQNKNLSIAILKQPFFDLKQLFKSEKAAAHQDIPEIIQKIDLIISEYEALDAVMKTVPPIPESIER